MSRWTPFLAAFAALCAGAASIRATAPTVGAVAYTADEAADSVTMIDLAAGVATGDDVAVGHSPWGVALSPAGDVLYVSDFGVGPELRFVSTDTRALLRSVALSDGEPRDVAATPDGAKVYVALHATNRVSVVDVASHAETTTIEIPSFAGQTGVSGLALTPDGSKLYVINPADSSYCAVSTATDAVTAGPFAAPTGALHGRVSRAGDKLMIVGSSAPVIVSTATDLAVSTALVARGAQSDVAIAGTTAYVANSSSFSGPSILDGDAAIDVYELSSNSYVSSFSLGQGVLTTAIAVSPDGTCGWVACLGNKGTVQPLDLVDMKETGVGIPTGYIPRTMAARVDPPAEVVLPSYFLPKLVKARLAGFKKDSLRASGVFDEGAGAADWTKPVRVTVGGFAYSATLSRTSGAGPLQFKDATSKLVVRPNVGKSSRGVWSLTVSKASLSGKIPPEGDLGLAFAVAGMKTATARVRLTKGAFVFGRTRGALLAPPFFPTSVTVKPAAAKPGTGSVRVKAGFSVGGVVPTALDRAARLRIDAAHLDVLILPAEFRPRAGRFALRVVSGSTTTTYAIDFRRETIDVSAARLDVPAQPAGPTEIVFDPGADAVPTRVDVKFGGTPATRTY
jgi:YVTN family beta-propeller protein